MPDTPTPTPAPVPSPTPAPSTFNLLAFFAQVENSLKGYLNLEELVKVVLTAVGSGTTMLGLLQAIDSDLAKIVIDPVYLQEVSAVIGDINTKNWVALAFGIITLVGETYRRLNQGQAVAL